MVSKQSIGKVAVAPRGIYSNTTQYYALDIVTYGSASYLAKQDVKGVTPGNTTYWQLVALGGSGSPALDSRGYLYWPST